MRSPKFNANLILTLASFVTLASCTSFAGVGSGGGGMVFICNPHTPSQKVYLADTYKLLRSKTSTLSAESMSYTDISYAISQSISKVDKTLAKQLLENLKELKFVPGGVLPLLGDDDIREIPSSCMNGVKAQLAIQDLSTGVVRYDTKLLNALSFVEQSLFKLHEAYIRIYKHNTNTVRSHVASEASNDYFLALLNPSSVMVTDKTSTKIAKYLAGRSLVCSPSPSSDQPVDRSLSNFFPLTLKAMDFGNGKTLLSVESGDSESIISSAAIVDYNHEGVFFQDGDDYWNQLSIQFDPTDLSTLDNAAGIFSTKRDDGVINDAQQISCDLK